MKTLKTTSKPITSLNTYSKDAHTQRANSIPIFNRVNGFGNTLVTYEHWAIPGWMSCESYSYIGIVNCADIGCMKVTVVPHSRVDNSRDYKIGVRRFKSLCCALSPSPRFSDHYHNISIGDMPWVTAHIKKKYACTASNRLFNGHVAFWCIATLTTSKKRGMSSLLLCDKRQQRVFWAGAARLLTERTIGVKKIHCFLKLGFYCKLLNTVLIRI